MGHGWSTDDTGEVSPDRREILDAVESWLVDPRPRPRLHHQSAPAAAPAEIRLDGDLAFGTPRT
jgi:hypothetical protein